ncbi:MAG TPA: hypothetical protein VFT99_15760, partial [Roseiflexaceae bacterium]|nr:hypothetical protein [Roseiflexaceae bacterium]
MLVRTAKALAAQWVSEDGSRLEGFAGAFSHGSINWMSDDALQPPTSDVDVMVLLSGPQPEVKIGKFVYQGVLLEVSFMPAGELADAERVLETPHLAGNLARATILADPNGTLRSLQRQVAGRYNRRSSVQQRCRQTEQKIRQFLASIDPVRPYHDQVSGWLFGTGCTTHVVLVAALRNPTVRQRYLAARVLLAEYGNLALYERLLELLGCAGLSRHDVERHMPALAAAFDAAPAVLRTPIFFAADLSADARPVAIDGSRALIEHGNHLEAS